MVVDKASVETDIGAAPPRPLAARERLGALLVHKGLITREQLEATRAFVSERGGGLLVLGARSFMKQGLIETPLEDVLPLDLSGRGGSASDRSRRARRSAHPRG